ncbi:MAG: tRNA (guanosine(46)-N7)-methyltransferase TrmB [Ginsengibacter sp.]
MAQKKLRRFEEINGFPNVLQYPEQAAGKWHSFFKNEQPVILELACGKGEYTLGLANLHPTKNFIGVDIKGNRIWVGAKAALEQRLENAAFLRTDILGIDNYFSTNEVDEIWITFPDPQLRLSKAKKRLTHPRFLNLYKNILKPQGIIHLKTDSPQLYKFTKEVISYYGLQLINDIDNVHQRSNLADELKIKTHYESLDIAESNTIFYVSFMLPEDFVAEEKSFSDYLKLNEA